MEAGALPAWGPALPLRVGLPCRAGPLYAQPRLISLQVVSLKMVCEPPGIVERINQHLPPQVGRGVCCAPWA